MNEREMLELAARAAGLLVIDSGVLGLKLRSDGCITGYMWNSLADDGDALRLASKLRLSVSFNLASVDVECWQDECGVTRAVIEYFHDPEEATAAARLAITRAAAEVGKAML